MKTDTRAPSPVVTPRVKRRKVDKDMEEGEKMPERKNLANRVRTKKLLDMEKIYRQLDSGRTVEEVAKEWGVSKSTLYRRHKAYQEYIKAMNRDVEEKNLAPEDDLEQEFIPPKVKFED